MYKQRSDGTYRLRASFKIEPRQVEGLNVICIKTGLNFSEVCSRAVDIVLEKYVKDGEFSYPDESPHFPLNAA
jgi:hypothetical protein